MIEVISSDFYNPKTPCVCNDDGTEILKGVDLEINLGEVHAIMGPNGSGKSTLANVIMGNPVYEVTDGKIIFENISLL